MADPLAGSAAQTPIVLASGSWFRAEMLRNAGLSFEIDIPGIDEASVRESLGAEGASADDVAVALAELKAVSVSRRHPEALVIGSDQMLDCNGVWFEKPVDRDHARATLAALSGRDHRLATGVVVALAGARIWHTLDSVRMRMRPLSEEFIEGYLETMGDTVCESVGGYQLEGLGGQLFTAVDGDYFTVLGLPLLPLLEFLRVRGVLAR